MKQYLFKYKTFYGGEVVAEHIKIVNIEPECGDTIEDEEYQAREVLVGYIIKEANPVNVFGLEKCIKTIKTITNHTL